MVTNRLSTVEPNSVIKHENQMYRVTKEGKAVDMQGNFVLISPEAKVEIIKNPEELAQAYLMLIVPINEIGNAFAMLANNLAQSQLRIQDPHFPESKKDQ